MTYSPIPGYNLVLKRGLAKDLEKVEVYFDAIRKYNKLSDLTRGPVLTSRRTKAKNLDFIGKLKILEGGLQVLEDRFRKCITPPYSYRLKERFVKSKGKKVRDHD
ncbi:hypothetical protein CEXT_224611 [Caerostris extrusa]|uniref:Uncharacterized protein n=1 Tax=Caerostris extrusa TaxID=172846 RepID=A0AAV4XWC1_CAEEX|nr:hypothetical protein CEXT_224611 [Caerostris extrusa]